MPPSSTPTAPNLRFRISRPAERKIRQGHPWVFENSIARQNREGVSGEMGVIYDRSDRFLALGLYDPISPIRLRILHQGKPTPVDETFWDRKVTTALARRNEVADTATNGLRWIYGENDGFPGLVLDGYDRTLVVKIYSAAWFPWLEAVQKALVARLDPERIVLRLSRNIQPPESHQDATVLHGSVPPGPVRFSESGIYFQADVLRGQKTGFFLDQRENRRRVEELSRDRTVLNTFSHSGGFSLYAARGGARGVVSVDQSAHALAELKSNWRLNEADPVIRNCSHEELQADVFAWLPEVTTNYGLVIIDPPSLAARKEDRPVALKAYQRLARSGLNITEKGGHLVCCSCSSHISREDFVEAIRQAVESSSRKGTITEVTGHAPDHPGGIPELDYLKAVWIRK